VTESRIEVQSLLRQFDHALDESGTEFGTNQWHSLIGNLSAVRPEEWDAAPPGGVRTIRELVTHVGGCYLMYENHAFGDRTLRWEDDAVDGLVPGPDVAGVIAWLRAAHGRFRASLAGLSDSQLGELTYGHWGGQLEARRVVELMIQHTTYHTGEVNEIRALLQGNDA